MNDEPYQPEPLPPYNSDFTGDRPQRDPYTPVFGEESNPKKAKGRLMMPGLFVIIIGILNLLPGAGCSGFGIMLNGLPDAEFEKQIQQSNPKQWAEAKQQGFTLQWYKKLYLYSGLGIGIASVVLALVAIVGGGCMMAGRSMFLCVIGALAAILSPGGCGVLGLAVGIWAFAVLFSEDVRAAFRAR